MNLSSILQILRISMVRVADSYLLGLARFDAASAVAAGFGTGRTFALMNIPGTIQSSVTK